MEGGWSPKWLGDWPKKIGVKFVPEIGGGGILMWEGGNINTN